MPIVPKPQKHHAEKMLSKVPVDNVFIARNGAQIHSLEELLIALKNMDADTFVHHVNDNKNDFKNWILDIVHDDHLADKIVLTRNKEVMIALIRERIEYYESIVSDVREEKPFVQKKEPMPLKVSAPVISSVKKITLPSIKKLTYTPLKKEKSTKDTLAATNSISKRVFASPVSRSSLSSIGSVVLPVLREKQVKIRSKLLQKKLDSIPLNKVSTTLVSSSISGQKKSVISQEQKEKESDIADIVSLKKGSTLPKNNSATSQIILKSISNPLISPKIAVASAETAVMSTLLDKPTAICPVLPNSTLLPPLSSVVNHNGTDARQSSLSHYFIMYLQELWHHAKAALIYGMIGGILIGFILAYVFF